MEATDGFIIMLLFFIWSDLDTIKKEIKKNRNAIHAVNARNLKKIGIEENGE